MNADPTAVPRPAPSRLARLIDVRRGELRAVGWAWLYVFALFLA